jgi:hypothetical protein
MLPPDAPIAIEDVIAQWPTLRQSLLSKFDDCPLSAYFEMRYSNGWNTHPQARGTLFHRYAAELLRTMKAAGHETIPVSEAIEILIEVCYQRGVPVEDIVRVPLREMKDLRMAAVKFARDNTFSTDRIVDIERRLAAKLEYINDDGQVVERTLTGQIDCLLFDPPNGAIVLDWKDTWALPPEPEEFEAGDERFDDDELKGISYHGYFQQRFYGWLVMKNYLNVEKVTLREFYVRKTKVRKATLHRHQLDDVEEQLRVLAHGFDRAFGSGAPPRPHAVATIGHWKPQPGKHCGFCVGARQCPIPEHVRIEAGGAVSTEEMAKRAAAELLVVDRIRDLLRNACKGWVDSGRPPIEVKNSKGRRVLGWTRDGRGRRFKFFTPDASDRGTHAADAQLEEAMKESTARARKERLGRRKAGRR